MDIELYERIRGEILDLLSKVGHLLPERNIDDVRVFADVAEFGLAVELICVQLYEYDRKLSAEPLKMLQSLVDELRLNDDLMDGLAAGDRAP